MTEIITSKNASSSDNNNVEAMDISDNEDAMDTSDYGGTAEQQRSSGAVAVPVAVAAEELTPSAATAADTADAAILEAAISEPAKSKPAMAESAIAEAEAEPAVETTTSTVPAPDQAGVAAADAPRAGEPEEATGTAAVAEAASSSAVHAPMIPRPFSLSDRQRTQQLYSSTDPVTVSGQMLPAEDSIEEEIAEPPTPPPTPTVPTPTAGAAAASGGAGTATSSNDCISPSAGVATVSRDIVDSTTSGTNASALHSNASSSQTNAKTTAALAPPAPALPFRCINPASEINSRLDTQVEVRVYPCNNSASGGGSNKKKFTTFTIKPEGVIIQGSNRSRNAHSIDLGAEYAAHVGRKLQRYELSDTRACQLLVTTHRKSFWVVPAPEAFSRHSGTCRLLGDRKHPPAPHSLQVGDFLRVGSVGVVVIETHDGKENKVLSEEKIQKIMKDTTNSNGGFLDLAETDGENSDDSMDGDVQGHKLPTGEQNADSKPVCYMCFDEEDTDENPMITPCKCKGDTQYVHVECLRKWHTAEADNQICFLSSVDATCSVCKSTFKSDFKLKDGRQVKLFKSSLEPPYVSLLVATKHEMAQRLFNTRFQLSFSTLLKPDGRNATRPLLLGRSSGSDMVLDYRTVSARHAAIRFKNGEFVFTDAGSSNGSYLYLRRPLELSPSQPVQFRLGRSMISMKVVNKWNRRLLRAVRRTTQGTIKGGIMSGNLMGGGNPNSNQSSSGAVRVDDDDDSVDDRSIGSSDGDVRIMDGVTGSVTQTVPRRTRESVMQSLPQPGHLSQQANKHLDLLYALAYPAHKKRDASHPPAPHSGGHQSKTVAEGDERKEEENPPQPAAAAAAASGIDSA